MKKQYEVIMKCDGMEHKIRQFVHAEDFCEAAEAAIRGLSSMKPEVSTVRLVEALEEAERKRVSVTLPRDVWFALTAYLSLTRGYRETERKKWEATAKERNGDGDLAYPSIAEKADFWDSMIRKLEQARETIDSDAMY